MSGFRVRFLASGVEAGRIGLACFKDRDFAEITCKCVARGSDCKNNGYEKNLAGGVDKRIAMAGAGTFFEASWCRARRLDSWGKEALDTSNVINPPPPVTLFNVPLDIRLTGHSDHPAAKTVVYSIAGQISILILSAEVGPLIECAVAGCTSKPVGGILELDEVIRPESWPTEITPESVIAWCTKHEMDVCQKLKTKHYLILAMKDMD